ncbi:MAG TPA: hypothetical protein VK789_29390 [Bryobacteraceae bacterium]|nr:hypothetical protein [Bryobacteraceae bacterium]
MSNPAARPPNAAKEVVVETLICQPFTGFAGGHRTQAPPGMDHSE